MKFLPLTLLATLSASLLMALVFIPTLGAYVGRPGAADPKTMKVLAAGESLDNLQQTPGITGAYVRVLQAALNHPAKIPAGAFAILIVVQSSYALFGKGVEFFPSIEPDFAKLQVRARGNLSIQEKSTPMAEVERHILALGDEKGEFKSIYTRTGAEKNSQEAEDIIGTVTLVSTDWDKRRKAALILADTQERVDGLAGIIVNPREQEHGPPVGKPVQIQLSSRFPDLLAPATAKVRAQFDQMDGLTNIEDSRPLPGIDWQLIVDRAQAAKFNANVDIVGRAVQLASTGIKLGD